MNNKGEVGFSSLFTAIIAVSAFTIFAALFIRGAGESYQITYNETALEQFDKSTEAASLALDTEQVVTGTNSTGTLGGNSNIDVITNSAFKTFPIIARTPIILNSLFIGVGDILGIPSQVVMLIFSLITFIIISVFILLIFRVNIN